MPKPKSQILAELNTAICKRDMPACNQLLSQGEGVFSSVDWNDLLIKFIQIAKNCEIVFAVNIILDRISSYHSNPKAFLKVLQKALIDINIVLAGTIDCSSFAPPLSIFISKRIDATEKRILAEHPLSLTAAVEDQLEYT